MNRLILILAMAALVACKRQEKQTTLVGSATTMTPAELASSHYKNMMSTLEKEDFPRSFEKDKLTTSNSEWWCSGFYPGTLLYLYEIDGDTVLFNEANRMLGLLEKEQFNTGTHDLGFMMFCSFGNANRLNSSADYKEVLINSAKSLSSRFSPEVGCIRSWDSGADDYIVIIDNMMNLELLFWATEETGDSSYYDIAVTHANTTLANHFREDNSSYHVVNYAPDGSGVQEKKTAQGLSDDSAWARGQAWGLYGYTVMFRATGDTIYLDQANKIAKFVMNHPNLPVDKVPVWDFDAASDAPRDASSAAIMASALLELDSYSPGQGYNALANEMLTSLSTNYLADLGANGNFLIEHCVGHLPANSEVDVPLTYADYYFIEAMLRAGRVGN
ncbi:Glycosyl Hydrolase Family 88 [Reichenbachiella agariperforans]|uniref:Glycosyl Hydrolase Family 88 n=1 Tax=Reichenbachiella agariperforans TaxID=156994 RepID=A0A1M6K6X3_REIAG|nr:glycoside hydrolase family 88 protein [Reichenbachiella agariperforans]SHJ54685.1 Glycosyl Hydrolase Family 88 [Reichenbachiella agariperforans]